VAEREGELDTNPLIGLQPPKLDTKVTHRGQFDVVDVLAAQCASPRAVDRFVMALWSASASFVARKVEDPESYLLQSVALELELADAEKAADDDDRDSDVN
jgi:hypothetical protein